MDFVLPPPAQPSVAILGEPARFPVRRIYCVGQNYADHVREMGSDPKKGSPIFFAKPADAVTDSATVPYPPNTAHLHHEVELVIAIGKAGSDIAASEALAHVWGYAVGVDLTRRDRQAEAKQNGGPWEVAKGCDQSAPIGALTPTARCGDPTATRIWLSVNGETRQDAHTSAMIWSVAEIIAAISGSWALAAGDLIFTGTPAGVGLLNVGDRVSCGIDGLAPLEFSIAERSQ